MNSKIDPAKVDIIKEGFAHVGPLLNELLEAANASQPFDPKAVANRSISGDKINGGRITNFESVGIKDKSSRLVVLVNDEGLLTDKIDVETLVGDTSVDGNLTVKGKISAEQLHVEHITQDTRFERSSSLEFLAANNGIHGKGLLWIGSGHTRQFVLKANPDRLWSTESLDLHGEGAYFIDGRPVLSKTKIGESVRESRLVKVGTLQDLHTSGNLTVDEFIFWDSGTMRLGIGTDTPNAIVSVKGLNSEFVIDPDASSVKAGTWTASGLDIITDDTPRISISSSGNVVVSGKTSFERRVGIGVRNFADDADLTVAGPVRFQEKKFEVAERAPTAGTYRQGDTVWNSNPTAGGYMGWVCTRSGSPGEWKSFGLISK